MKLCFTRLIPGVQYQGSCLFQNISHVTSKERHWTLSLLRHAVKGSTYFLIFFFSIPFTFLPHHTLSPPTSSRITRPPFQYFSCKIRNGLAHCPFISTLIHPTLYWYDTNWKYSRICSTKFVFVLTYK